MGGGQTSTNTSTTSIDPRIVDRGIRISDAVTNVAMPGGSLPAYQPYNDTTDRVKGTNVTAGLNQYHDRAAGSAHQAGTSYGPLMNNAQTAAGGAYRPFGREVTVSNGTSPNPQPAGGGGAFGASGGSSSGGASGGYGQQPAFNPTPPNSGVAYAPFNTQTMQGLMNPYQNLVTTAGINELRRQHDISQLGINDAAVKAGAFGGSRHGVQNAETTRGFADMGQKFLADTLDRGYSQARDQYNKGFDQLLASEKHNLDVNKTDSQNAQNAAQLWSTLADRGQIFGMRGMQAYGQVGDMYQGAEQKILDAARAEKNAAYEWPLGLAGQVASINAGTPTSRTTTSAATQPTNWLGTALQVGGGLVGMFSDERAKEGIKKTDPEKTLGAFGRLKIRKYRYTDDAKSHGAPEGEHTGPMAQSWHEEMESEAPIGPGGYQGISFQDAIGRLTEAVQGLEARTRHLAPGKPKRAYSVAREASA